MSSKKPKSVHFKGASGGHKHHIKKKKHSTHTGSDNSGPHAPDTALADSGSLLAPTAAGSGNFLHPDTASTVYDHIGGGRRRSSIMIEYYRDNYMGIKTGEVTDQHLQDIRDTFELLDRDKDGKLSTQEITNLLRYIGSLKTDCEMEEMLAPIDSDHNGAIDFEEFKKFILEKDLLKSLADEVNYEMQDAFNIFDKNGDGFIEKDELKRVLTSIGDRLPEELADEFIQEADLNGDGKIDYKEFCKHMGY